MDAFKITSLMVPQVPDAHVLWNIRREIILHWKTNGHPFNNKATTTEEAVDACPVADKKTDGNSDEEKTDEEAKCQDEAVPAEADAPESKDDNSHLVDNEVEKSQLENCVKLQKVLGSLEISNEKKPVESSRELTWEEENERLMDELYKKELEFTAMCLVQQPKSYAVWHHRGFIIVTMNSPDYMAELKACDKFLDMDERNCE